MRTAPVLNVLIADDEPLAQDVLAHHCAAHSDLRVVGRCRSAAEALAALEANPVDLMFLDVRMPRFGGLELLRGLTSPPLTVIVSAHREHAFDGYELDVVDYLLKPVSAARFADAVEKVRRRLAEELPPKPPTLDIVLKVDRTLRRVLLDEISCLQAQGNFVLVRGAFGQVMATTTLKALLAALPTQDFVQVHKSFIVRCAAIVEQTAQELRLADGTIVPIGKSYRGKCYLPAS